MTNGTLGSSDKDGVVIYSGDGYQYYRAQGDSSLTPFRATKTSGEFTPRKLKVTEGCVKVANSEFTVTVYPDRRIEIQPNELN